MAQTGLLELGDLDGAGQARFRIARADSGDLVLWHPDQALAKGMRELDAAERIRLAELSTERPALVVETSAHEGHYVVLIDEPVDLERHVPLGPGDAELLDHVNAVATFGRRDDDVLTLTPWGEDDGVVYFDADSADFDDLALVSLGEDGALHWHRGGAAAPTASLIRVQLRSAGAAPDVRYAVLTNPFGECVCIADGSPLLPHEDVRRQALVGISGLLDGAATLDDAAQRLRRFADRLEEAAAVGWKLSHAVTEDTILAELPE